MRRGKRKKEKIGRKCEWEQMKLFAATELRSCTRADKQIFAETKQKTTTQGRMESNGMEMIWTRSRTRENREDEGGEVSQRRGINCNCWLWSRKEHWTDKAWQGEETYKRWENEEPKGRPNSADRWKRNDRCILHSCRDASMHRWRMRCNRTADCLLSGKGYHHTAGCLYARQGTHKPVQWQLTIRTWKWQSSRDENKEQVIKDIWADETKNFSVEFGIKWLKIK